MNGPIWALASDGDSTYHAAKHIICIVKKVDKDSPLGKTLLSLFGLNCWTSTDGATSTCDPKHIFKRFATLLRSVTGIMLDDNNILPDHIIEHLTDLPNMTMEKALWVLWTGWLFNSITREKRWWHYYHIKLSIPLCSDAIWGSSKIYQV